MKNIKKRIVSLVLVVIMVLTTFLPEVGTLTAKAATTTKEHMVVTSPWAYNLGKIDNSQTYTDGGYEYATLVPGGEIYYHPALMKDIDMSVYSEIRFAVKTNGSYWYEGGLAATNDFGTIVGADTTWTEYAFKYEEASSGYRLYKNGNSQSTVYPADMNLSDLHMKFSADTNAVLYMTEVRGTLKAGMEPSLKVIADSFNDKCDMTVSTEEPNFAATKSNKAKTSWSGTQASLASVDLNSYEKVLFYARKAGRDDLSGWFESAQLGSFQMDYNWTEFKLEKNADGTWNIYTAGVLKQSNQTLTNLSDITACYGDNMYYFSEVFAVEGEGAELPEITDDLVVISPWTYKEGKTDHSKTYAAGAYEYATVIPGGQVYWDAPLMLDADMSVYSEFRFALKTNGSYYYEVCNAGAGFDANNIFSGAETEWMEYSFKYEDDGEGNVGYRMYKNGNWQSILLPADLNLSDLQMRFSSNTSAEIIITEVRGTLKDGATLPLTVIADNFNGETGTIIDTELVNGAASKLTEVKTSWSDTRNPLTSVTLNRYDKILFYARKANSDYNTNAWLESDALTSFVVTNAWTEFKLVRNADNTWNVYVGGVQKQSNMALADLSEITATYGDDTYYFSQLFGVENKNLTNDAVGLVKIVKAKAAYQADKNSYEQKYDLLQNDVINWQDVKWLRQDILETEHEYVVATSPWAYYRGSFDNSQTYSEGGYEYATLVPGGEIYYHPALMKDVDLSIYSEIRFAVKTNGDYWYEGGLASANDFGAIVGNTTDWVEYSFKYVDDGAGTRGFQMYRNGEVSGSLLPADLNLSDLQMKFSSDTSAVLYMTEVRGIVKDDVRLPLEVVTGNFNAEAGTTYEKEGAIIDATMSTKVTTSWSQTQNPLTSVDLSLYNKILFYARKGDNNTSAWLESNLLGSFVVENNWTEFKLVKNANGTWNVYVGGVLKQSNQALTDLSNITATYGDATYYFSEVFGVSTAEPIVLLNESQQAMYSVEYSNSNEKFAADEFTTYMNDATGATYTSATVNSVPARNEKKIVLGADLATKAGFSTSELSTDNGYAIKRKGDNLYIFGKTTQGTLNGVYALLKDAVGLEIYTDEVATDTYESGAITLRDTNVVFNPTIDYVYDMNRETRDDEAYRKKLGFTVDWEHLGGSDHEEGEFINSTYYTGTASNGHVDLTNATTQKEVAQYLYETYIVGRPGLSDFRFGLADDTKWFNSTSAGSARTAQYVKFMNAVAQELQALMDANNAKRDINLILLAYLSTVQAPTDGTTFANTENITLQVAYAPLEANWYVPLSHEDNNSIPSEVSSSITYDADAELQKWANIAGSGNVLLWAYHAFPGNYLTPFDSLNALQKNYALAAQCGVSAVYDIAQWAPDGRDGATLGDGNDTSTDWTRLKVYLSNELAKNPTMSETEYNQLIDNFMNAYFMVAEVATAMKEALSAERALMEDVYTNVKTMKYGWFDSNSISFEYRYGSRGGYHTLIDMEKEGSIGSAKPDIRNAAWGWSGSGDHPMMTVYTKMKNAYDAIDSASIDDTQKAILKERIQLEALSVRFILLRVAGKDVSSDFGGSAGFAGLANDCINLGVTKVGENSSGINRDMTAENLNKDDL